MDFDDFATAAPGTVSNVGGRIKANVAVSSTSSSLRNFVSFNGEDETARSSKSSDSLSEIAHEGEVDVKQTLQGSIQRKDF